MTTATKNGAGEEVLDVEAAARLLEEQDGPYTKDPLIEDLKKQVRSMRARERKLLDELDVLTPQLRRYEKALKVLEGEPIRAGRPPKDATKKRATRPNKIGPEKLGQIREAVLEFADTHEEFRQVDIRGVMDVTSGVTAIAFEMLRQENLIRFARQDGNNKWYRLTREALNDNG